jgi:hypothetical protein
MIWDAEHDWKPNMPARVFDADGNEIRDIVRMATETGSVVTLRRDETGTGYLPTPDGHAIFREWRHHPAPLTVVMMEPTA